MNEFPEGTLSLPHIGSGTYATKIRLLSTGHVRVPSLELFILHITKSSWLAGGRLSGTVLQAKFQNTEQKKTEIE